jgi:hypothetical protein
MREIAACIYRLRKSSALASSVFSYAALKAAQSQFEEDVRVQLSWWCNETMFGEKELTLLKQRLANAAKRSSEEGSNAKRVVELEYLQGTLQIEVAGFQNQWELHLWKCIKEEALSKVGGLERLPYEEMVLPRVEAASCRVPPSILEEMKAARSLAMEVLQDNSIKTFTNVLSAMEQNASNFYSLDRSFKLDMCWLKTAAEPMLEERLGDELLATLPDQTHEFSVEETIQALQQLQGSELTKYLSTTAAARWVALLDMVSSFARGFSPEKRLLQDKWWGRCLRRLTFYADHIAHLEGGKTQRVRGLAAIQLKLADKRFQAQKGRQLTLADIEAVARYKFILDEAQARELSTWMEGALGGVISEEMSEGGPPLPATVLPEVAGGKGPRAAAVSVGGSTGSNAPAPPKDASSLMSFFG